MSNTNTDFNRTELDKRSKNSAAVNVPDQVEQGPQACYTPLVDIVENEDAFVFQADLPGVAVGDVDVSFENGTLTIEAKAHSRQPAGQHYVWREYGVGHFYRSFNIETPVNADGIKAQLKNGVLELFVPKVESARSRKIEIKTA